MEQAKYVNAASTCAGNAPILPEANTTVPDTVFGTITNAAAELLSAYSDIDPDEELCTCCDVENSKQRVQVRQKLKLSIRNKKGPKRVKTQSKWVDVKAKR